MYKGNTESPGPDLKGIANIINLFSEQDCELLIGFALQEEPMRAMVFGKNGLVEDKSIRSVTQFYMSEEKYPGLYEKIKHTFKVANSWRFNISSVPSIQIFRYLPGDHYSRHTDWSINKNRRKLSMTVQLSQPEDYEGGEVIMMAGPEDIAIPMNCGTATIWPAWSLHEVVPVTDGERWCLVAWAEGEPFH